MFSWGRAGSIARKEVRQILRDPFTLAMALSLPVLLVLFFGFVIDFDVKHVQMLVADRDQSASSRALRDTFTGAQYFDLQPSPVPSNFVRLVDAEKVKAVLVIERGFEKALHRAAPAPVQIIVDGADNQTAGIIAGYLMGLQQAVNRRLRPSLPRPAVTLETRFLFNPELNSRWFIIPGLAVVVVGILSILLTALTVAREWENGSMELLLSTPVRPLEIIIGKLAPYTALGLVAIGFVYLAARLVFGVPFLGSHLLYLFACLIFLGCALAQGLLISVVTRQQQLAMQLANMTGMLPALMLSGFIFPIESMPKFFQGFTALLAPRWFMEVSRGVFLKGMTWTELAGPLFYLCVINAALLVLARKKFKTDLEP
jgi:ABC-2 type transport system permease protein